MNKTDLNLEKMLEAGLHFGHRTSRWHPKMKPFIFTQKNGIHIINLAITQKKLEEALDYIDKLVKDNKKILFISTKDQAKSATKELALSIDMPYITEKWMGGTLTNFEVIKKSINKYKNLLNQKQTGKLSKYTKKEQLDFDREIEKLELKVGGLTSLIKTPDAIFIWDAKKESTALKEAIKTKIPVIAVCDTNTNPTGISYTIPANDDSTKGLVYILSLIKGIIKKS